MHKSSKHAVSVARVCRAFVFGIATFVLSTPAAFAQVTQRPLSDFLSAQGAFLAGVYLFVPPDPNFLGWSTMFPPPKLPVVRTRPAMPLFAGVDYAGLADAYAPGNEPKFSGSVMERPLADGRAEVTVLLHTTNANAWVIDLDLSGDVLDQIANRPTLFGHRPRDVKQGAGQALADSLLHVRFVNTAPGAPLPDVAQLSSDPSSLPDVTLEFLAFTASAAGPLTVSYGVPENTPGKCTIVQTGLLLKVGQSRALTDGFPVEDIVLHAIGE